MRRAAVDCTPVEMTRIRTWHMNTPQTPSTTAASAVINTILTAPEDHDLAARFYCERAELGFRRNARIGRDFYRLEERQRTL